MSTTMANAPRGARSSAAPASSTPSSDVFARTVPLVIERHYFGETKQTSMSQVEIANLPPEDQAKAKALLHLRKRLLRMPETRAIRQRDTQFRLLLGAKAIPWRPSFYLVSLPMVEAVDTDAQTWVEERETLADTAAEAYPAMVRAMADDLGPLYNPMDYPSKERFRSAFWVSYRFIDMGVPNVLRELKADVFARERRKAEAAGQKACAAIEQHLAGSLLKITDHLSDLLAPRANGKLPQLYDGALDKLLQFVDTLAMRDVTNFRQLQTVTARLRRVATGLDIETLRDDVELRARTAAAVEEAKTTLGRLVTEETRRAIRLRSDDDEE